MAVDDAPVLTVLIRPGADSRSPRVMLVHRLYRSRYFPRTPPRMSYSGRKSSFSGWSFSGLFSGLIGSPFSWCSWPCSDETDRFPSVRVPHDYDSSCRRKTHRQPALLIGRMVWIKHGRRQRIAERRDGFLERHSMLSEVRDGFFVVPVIRYMGHGSGCLRDVSAPPFQYTSRVAILSDRSLVVKPNIRTS